MEINKLNFLFTKEITQNFFICDLSLMTNECCNCTPERLVFKNEACNNLMPNLSMAYNVSPYFDAFQYFVAVAKH